MSGSAVITRSALNRATLARQHLLERSTIDPVAAAGTLGGLQAQEPASPFIALWSRLTTLDAAEVRAATEDRRLVKATLMRSTLHLVPAPDYRRIQPAMTSLFESGTYRARGDKPDEARFTRLRRSALELASIPRRNSDLRDHIAELDPGGSADDTWWWVRRHIPLVHAPSGGAWAYDRRPWLVAADAWLTGDAGFADEWSGLVHLVRRYLGAFGPASVADAASWSRLAISRLRPAFQALDAAGELVNLRDESGRALVDLVDSPRPDPAVPVPPRLLPMWDSLLLAHADRSRVISDAARARVIDVNGDTYPTFLVDGQVAGLWWARREGGRTVIDLEPFADLDAPTRRALDAETEGLAAFVEPLEPEVYRRFRGSRARRLDRHPGPSAA